MRLAGWLMLGSMVLACALPEARPAGEAAWAVGELASSLEVGVAPGEVRLALHVTNATSAPLEFTFPTSQRYDFVVEGLGGERLWRWSDDRAFTQVVTRAVLEPGETWTMEAVWEHGGRAGAHVAAGQLTSQDRPVEQRASFELP
jgi:hypothetical protein